jgi:glutathione peroxidase
MRYLGVISVLLIFMSVALAEDKNVHSFTLKDIDGKEKALSDFKGKVVLIVNVASKCGLTPQYKQLQALHDKYSSKGLTIIGFPANNFGKQEPGTNKEIKVFCKGEYNVSFQMMSKIDVKGSNKHELYKYLTEKTKGKEINWNFEKFLIGPNGDIVSRFSPKTKPDSKDVVAKIEAQLAKLK